MPPRAYDSAMARHEAPREDPLAEATALVERIELRVGHDCDPVVIGFRRGGEASIYFGAAAAYHFNSACELRRAFEGDQLIKAERGKLAALSRHRTDQETQLLRHDFSAEETSRFVAELHDRMTRLRESAESHGLHVLRQVPADGNVLDRVADWLARFPLPITIARAPHVA